MKWNDSFKILPQRVYLFPSANKETIRAQCTPVGLVTPTCFAFACSVKVVVGAQQFALSVRPTVVDARGQVGAHVHLGRDIRARLESGKIKSQTGRTWDGGERGQRRRGATGEFKCGWKGWYFPLNRFQREYSYFILKLIICGWGFFCFFFINTGLWRCQCQSVCAPLYPHSINIKLIFDVEVKNRLPSWLNLMTPTYSNRYFD